MKIYDFNGSKNIAEQEKRKGSRKKCSARLQTEGANIARDSVSRIEIGSRFVADHELAALCKVLNVSPPIF